MPFALYLQKNNNLLFEKCNDLFNEKKYSVIKSYIQNAILR